VEIIYLGEMRGGDEVLVDEHGRIVHRFIQCDFSPDYAGLAKTFEAEDRKGWGRSMKKPGWRIKID